MTEIASCAPRHLHAADPRWGRRINSTGPISDDTVAYRVGTSPVNPLSIDIVLAAHTTHARLQWHTYDHWAETPGAHPTISRHISVYPGISRILFLFAGTKAAARQSWLNLVERWFAELTNKQLRPGSHRSVRSLEAAIWEFLDTSNADGKPFVWSKSADEILASIARFAQRTLAAHS